MEKFHSEWRCIPCKPIGYHISRKNRKRKKILENPTVAGGKTVGMFFLPFLRFPFRARNVLTVSSRIYLVKPRIQPALVFSAQPSPPAPPPRTPHLSRLSLFATPHRRPGRRVPQAPKPRPPQACRPRPPPPTLVVCHCIVAEPPKLIQLKCPNYHLHTLQWSNLTVCRVKSR
jgi:hypothetical protein